MQSGFGGVSEIQQFMVDGSTHPCYFSISSATPPQHNQPTAVASVGGQEIFHSTATAPSNKLINTFHRYPNNHPQYHHPSPPPLHFPHFHSNIPVTQQLFTPPPPHHHHHHHNQHFQLFNPTHHDHRRLLATSPALDHDPNQENSVSDTLLPAGGNTQPSFLSADMKFKLAIDESSVRGSREGVNNENDVNGGILHGDTASESRIRSWHREDDCAIKEPFWRPLDLDYINSNNKRCKAKEPAEVQFAKRSTVAGNNYKLFSELEAIYKPGSSNSTANEGGNNNHTTTHPANQTTGSSSALTGDDHPLIPPATADLDYRLEDDNSTGGEAHTNVKKVQHHSRRRRRRRKMQMGSIAAFFEGLLKQLIDHQEVLHQKFLEAMEQRDRERAGQEDAWREQEAARVRREASVRAHERGLGAAREAAIVSFLEKITGETINLPPFPQPNIELADGNGIAKDDDFKAGAVTGVTMLTSSRWPKVEVQALIRVRSELDGQFQEPGLKGPLWEEVSAAMASMGYNRSAKRCKEKWENINKYFRKSKDSGRKRSQHSKTCPYFHQLDQLYSKSLPSPQSVPAHSGDCRINNSELLDAVIIAGDHHGFSIGEEVGESDGRTLAEDDGDDDDEEADDESSPFIEQLQ